VCAELLAITVSPAGLPAPVLTEVCYLIEARNGTRAAAAFTELAKNTMTLEPTTTSVLVTPGHSRCIPARPASPLSLRTAENHAP
jgi:hypothetical protein